MLWRPQARHLIGGFFIKLGSAASKEASAEAGVEQSTSPPPSHHYQPSSLSLFFTYLVRHPEPFQCIKWNILTLTPLPMSPVWLAWTHQAWHLPMQTSVPAAKPVASSTTLSGPLLGPPQAVHPSPQDLAALELSGITRAALMQQVRRSSPSSSSPTPILARSFFPCI